MQVPANMTTPKLKLGYGEEVAHTFSTLRRKGLFGNLYGELHITNQRIAFVKAVMSGIAAAAVSRFGVKPAIGFDRSTIRSIDKLVVRKRIALVISDGQKTERFLVDEAEADAVIAMFAPRDEQQAAG
jgi:hypothetical protein